MFIALQHHYLCAPAERDVLWRVPLHTAPYGVGWIRNAGANKHVAPPEQEHCDCIGLAGFFPDRRAKILH
jgi:hypothetical protein